MLKNRTLIRKLAIGAVGAIATMVLIGPVGEFFIELAREQGLYSAPSRKLAAASGWIAAIVGSYPFGVMAGLVLGFAAGIWLDAMLRKREGDALRIHHIHSQAKPVPTAGPAQPTPLAVDPERRPLRTDVPSYPFKKAVLQVEGKPKSSGSKIGDQLSKTDCTLVVANKSLQTLTCTIHAVSIESPDGTTVLNRPVRRPLPLPKGQSFSIIFITRDLADVVSKPPHILHLKDEPIALPDGREYRLNLELRSEYEFPTLVTLLIKAGREFVDVSVESQAV